MDAYAVVETGGKQYRVSQGDRLDVESIEADPGAVITLDRVLAVSDGKALSVGTPLVEGAQVTAEVIAHHRAQKLVSFKKKRRKGYHRKVGHRQELTQIQVQKITAG